MSLSPFNSFQSRFVTYLLNRPRMLQISTVPVRDYVALRVSTVMQTAATVVHEYERQCKHTYESNHTKNIRPNSEISILMFQLYLEQISTNILVMSIRFCNVVCFLLGDSLASEFYMPTFQSTLPVPSS